MEFRVSVKKGITRGAEYIEFGVDCALYVPDGEDWRTFARIRTNEAEAYIAQTIAAYTEAHPDFQQLPAQVVVSQGGGGQSSIEWIPLEAIEVATKQGKQYYSVIGGRYKLGVAFYAEHHKNIPWKAFPETYTKMTPGLWKAKIELRANGKPWRCLGVFPAGAAENE